MNYDLSLVYDVSYPLNLPFDGKKKDFDKFIYSSLLASAVDFTESKDKEIDFMPLYLYLMSKCGYSLDDIRDALANFKSMKKLNIDKKLYAYYCDDELFDAINSILDIRKEYFDKLVGMEDYYNLPYFPDEFVIEHCKAEELKDAIKDSTENKEHELLLELIDKLYSKNPRHDQTKLFYYIMNKLTITANDISKELKKMLNNCMDVKITRLRIILKENLKDNLVVEASKRLEEAKIEKEATKDTKRVNRLNHIDKLSTLIVGQDSATSRIIDKLKSAFVGFHSKNEPIASFLLTGPTGVGKTETAKTVAELCCGGHIHTIDMSTFKSDIDVSRLIGASPNYVGYTDKNEFCEFIKAHPDGVILFDEIEKSHNSCLDILLRILDEAEFVDAKGIKYDLSNNIIFCTTNLSEEKRGLGFSAGKESVEYQLSNNGIKKEIIGRFHEVIEFGHLSQESCIEISKRFINKKIQNFLENNKNNLTIKYSNALVDKIITDADTILLGARDIKKSIQKNFIAPISNYIYKNNPENVDIYVDAENIYVIEKTVEIKENINKNIEENN